MRDLPIIFTGPNVRSVLDGKKTQTRRVVKEQREHGGLWFGHGCSWSAATQPTGLLQVCPYGHIGGRLWARETWHTSIGADAKTPASLAGQGWPVWYAADGAQRFTGATNGGQAFMTKGKVRSSRYMPRWASRLMLEVTEARVERIQEISEADALAEGVQPSILEHWTAYDPKTESYPSFSLEPDAETIARRRLENVRHHGPKVIGTAVEQFRHLWQSINGEREGCTWEVNPWCWVISFKVVSQ